MNNREEFNENFYDSKDKFSRDELKGLIELILLPLKQSQDGEAKYNEMIEDIQKQSNLKNVLDEYSQTFSNELKEYNDISNLNDRDIILKNNEYIKYIVNNHKNLTKKQINWLKNQSNELVYQIYINTEELKNKDSKHNEELSREEKIIFLAGLDRSASKDNLSEKQQKILRDLSKLSDDDLNDLINTKFNIEFKKDLPKQSSDHIKNKTKAQDKNNPYVKQQQINLDIDNILNLADDVNKYIFSYIKVNECFNEREIESLDEHIKNTCEEEMQELINESYDEYIMINTYYDINYQLENLGMDDEVIESFYQQYEIALNNNPMTLNIILSNINTHLKECFKEKIITDLSDKTLNTIVSDEILGECKFHERLNYLDKDLDENTYFTILDFKFLYDNCKYIGSQMSNLFKRPRYEIINDINAIKFLKNNFDESLDSNKDSENIYGLDMYADSLCYKYIMTKEEKQIIDDNACILGKYKDVCPNAFYRFRQLLRNLKI